MRLLIRRVALYINYMLLKIKYYKTVDFQGFTVVYHDRKSCIRLINDNPKRKIEFQSDDFSNMLGVSQKCIVVARHGGKIEIGEATAMSGTTVYAMQEIIIGKNVNIGVNCKIIDNDFHPLRAELREPYDPDTIAKKAVFIDDDCFIGANSIILKGTRLGKNCVVGAGSVVHGSWPDNSIIAGNPAKFIRENI